MSGLPKQVDYHQNIQDAPKYRFLQEPPINNAASSLNPMTNTSQKVQFKAPAGTVINLYRTNLQYTMLVDGLAATLSSWINDEGLACIESIQLVTNKGTIMADIPFCNRYVRLTDKYYTRRDKFLTRDFTDVSYPAGLLFGANPTVSHTIPANTVYNQSAGDIVNTLGFVSYHEPAHYAVSLATIPQNLAKIINLGDIGHGTLFAQDIDICLKHDVYLNITFAPVNSFAFSTVNSILNPLATPAALAAGTVHLTNLMINWAVEDNKVLASSVINKFESGSLVIPTDFTVAFRNVCNSAVSNINIVLPQENNTKLKRVINAFYDADETLNKTFDSQNLNGVKVSGYQTSIDSQQLQNSKLTCKMSSGTVMGNTDYQENKKFIAGSVIEGVPLYQYYWVHIDEFSGDDSITRADDYHNHVYGLDMDVSRNYLLKLDTPQAAVTSLAQYSFFVQSRHLALNSSEIAFV